LNQIIEEKQINNKHEIKAIKKKLKNKMKKNKQKAKKSDKNIKTK
jgi:hypothetical protein